MPYVAYYFGPTIGRLTDKAGKRLISMNDTGAGIMNYDPNVDPTNTSTKIGSLLANSASLQIFQHMGFMAKMAAVDPKFLDVRKLDPSRFGRTLPEGRPGRVEAYRQMKVLRQAAGKEPAPPAAPAPPPKKVTPEMVAAARGEVPVSPTESGAVRVQPKISLLAKLFGKKAPAYYTKRHPAAGLPSGVTPEEAAKRPSGEMFKAFREELPAHLRHLTEVQRGKVPGFLRTQFQYPWELAKGVAGGAGRLARGAAERVKERVATSLPVELGGRLLQKTLAQRRAAMLRDPEIGKGIAARAGIPYEPRTDFPSLLEAVHPMRAAKAPSELASERAERGRVAKERRAKGIPETRYVTPRGEEIPTKTQEDIRSFERAKAERGKKKPTTPQEIGARLLERGPEDVGKGKIKNIRKALKEFEEPAPPKALAGIEGKSPAYEHGVAAIRHIPEGALSPEERSSLLKALKQEGAAGPLSAGALRKAVSKLPPEKQKIVGAAMESAKAGMGEPGRVLVPGGPGGFAELPIGAPRETPSLEFFEAGPTRKFQSIDVEHPLVRPWRSQVEKAFEQAGKKFDPSNPQHIDVAMRTLPPSPEVQRAMKAAESPILKMRPHLNLTGPDSPFLPEEAVSFGKALEAERLKPGKVEGEHVKKFLQGLSDERREALYPAFQEAMKKSREAEAKYGLEPVRRGPVEAPKREQAAILSGQLGGQPPRVLGAGGAFPGGAQDPLMARHTQALGIPQQPSGGLSPEEAEQFRRMMAVQSGQAPVDPYLGAAGQKTLPGWLQSILPYVGMMGAMQIADVLGLGAAGGLPAMMIGPAAAQGIAGRLGYGGGELVEPAQKAYVAGLSPQQFAAQYRRQ